MHSSPDFDSISLTFVALLPIDLHQLMACEVKLSEGNPESSSMLTLKVRKMLKNFLLSPIRIAFEIHGRYCLTKSSIGTGATFSPPDVMRISLILPDS